MHLWRIPVSLHCTVDSRNNCVFTKIIQKSAEQIPHPYPSPPAPAEHLLKMSLEDLREFLQETISRSFFLSDDVVVEQLQVSISELRKMKIEPGAFKKC